MSLTKMHTIKFKVDMRPFPIITIIITGITACYHDYWVLTMVEVPGGSRGRRQWTHLLGRKYGGSKCNMYFGCKMHAQGV